MPTETTAVSPEELLKRPVLTVVEAGIVLGIKKDAAYEAARRGQIPTIKINGRTLRVPTAQLKALLEGEQVASR